MLAQIPPITDSLIPIQIHAISPRSTQSHSDLLCLNQTLAISHRFAQPHAISPTPIQIHPISLRFALNHADSCNLTQICSALCSFTQIRSDSQNFTPSHSDQLNLVQICSDPFSRTRFISNPLRYTQSRSRFSLIPTGSFRFTQIHSDLLRQAQTDESWREKGNAPAPRDKGKREGDKTVMSSLI